MPRPLFASQRGQAGRDGASAARSAQPESTAFRRGREAAALLLIAGAAFIALGLASYAGDPHVPEVTGSDWVGPVGSTIAGALVGSVGLLSWFVPIELLVMALPLFRDRPSIASVARLAGDFVVLFIITPALIHVSFPTGQAFGAMPVGGAVGELFGELMRSLFSTIGSYIIGFTAIGLILIARASFSFIAFARKAGQTTEQAAKRGAQGMKALAEAWAQARAIEQKRAEQAQEWPSLATETSPSDKALLDAIDEELAEASRDASDKASREAADDLVLPPEAPTPTPDGSLSVPVVLNPSDNASSTPVPASVRPQRQRRTRTAAASASSAPPSVPPPAPASAPVPSSDPTPPSPIASPVPAAQASEPERPKIRVYQDPVRSAPEPASRKARAAKADLASASEPAQAPAFVAPPPSPAPAPEVKRPRAKPEPAIAESRPARPAVEPVAPIETPEPTPLSPSPTPAQDMDDDWDLDENYSEVQQDEMLDDEAQDFEQEPSEELPPVAQRPRAPSTPKRSAPAKPTPAPVRSATGSSSRPMTAPESARAQEPELDLDLDSFDEQEPEQTPSPSADLEPVSVPAFVAPKAPVAAAAVRASSLPVASDPTPSPEPMPARKSPPPPPMPPAAAAPVEEEIVRKVPSVAAEFQLPTVDLLDPGSTEQLVVDEELQAQLNENAEQLVTTLNHYGVRGAIREIQPGPTVTTYELEPEAGTKVSKIASLADDLAMNLGAQVRIIAPIPGKKRVGFEIPNKVRQAVNLRELIEDKRFVEQTVPLPVVLGRDIVGAPYYADLASMPHVLVAGATGAGKSVGLNVMLVSLLYQRTPEDLRLLMIDPKVVELQSFDKIPHMLLPVVTDTRQASNALKWAVDEMERRYQLLANAGTKNIKTYNAWVERVLRGEVRGYLQPKATVVTSEDGLAVEFGPEKEAPKLPEKLPYIVIVVDEFADLMMQQGKEVEASIARLAQKARAAGMHVILATQRPSVDVITGMIKANFPTRIAFKVTQRIDSRTILDESGADHLLGRGDMLVKMNGTNETKRVQCPFVSEEEVERVTHFLRLQGEPTYDESILQARDEDGQPAEPEDAEQDSKYDEAVQIVAETRRCSTSWLQRKLGIGYNRAANIVEMMEKRGIVGPSQGAKEREVLIAPL